MQISQTRKYWIWGGQQDSKSMDSDSHEARSGLLIKFEYFAGDHHSVFKDDRHQHAPFPLALFIIAY